MVNFEGGMMTRYGITPAEYTTSDAFKQKVIEQSDYFKNGRIKLLRVSGDDKKIGRSVKDVSTPADNREKGEEPNADAENNEEGLTEVEVACLTDAQNYLKEHFGIASGKIRNWDKAMMVGRENGVVFTGIE